MKQVTIRWGTEGNEEKTYTFNNEHDLKMFMKGVDEANGWLEYYIVEEKKKETFENALKIEDEEEDDHTHCDGCDDYFLDDERCECEEG